MTLLLLALPLTAGVAAFVNWYAENGTWLHDFFFARRFVQWVLIYAFFVGLLGAIRRIPQLRRDRAFARRVHSVADPAAGPSRWQGVLKARRISDPAELGVYLAALKESEASEVDGGYRIPSDVTQLLPLIGFFGTVFGLSMGLYSSFLVQGDTTTRSFATAIAIAFDNTLLGLALTIVLFAITSVLRKMDESVSARIEHLGNETLKELFLREREHGHEHEVSFAHNTARLEKEMEFLRQSSIHLAKMLPAAMERAGVLAETLHNASAALTNAVLRQNEGVYTLIEAVKQVDQEAAANLDRTIGKLQRGRDSAHGKLAAALKRAMKRRNRELIDGLNAALWQPRTIVVMDGAPQPQAKGAPRPPAGKDATNGSRAAR